MCVRKSRYYSGQLWLKLLGRSEGSYGCRANTTSNENLGISKTVPFDDIGGLIACPLLSSHLYKSRIWISRHMLVLPRSIEFDKSFCNSTLLRFIHNRKREMNNESGEKEISPAWRKGSFFTAHQSHWHKCN